MLESSKVFYTVALGFSLGVFFRSFVVINIYDCLWLLLVGVGLFIIGQRVGRGNYPVSVVFIALFVLFFSLGSLRLTIDSQNEVSSDLESKVGKTVELTGVVSREPDVRRSTQHLYTKIGNDLVLVNTNRHSEVEYGDYISVEGKLSKPESFTTEFNRTFNYPGYLKAKGVSYSMSFSEIVVIEKNKGNRFVAALLKIKGSFMEKIELNLSEPYAGLGEGLLLGVKKALGPELEESFRKTGIIHIVVLSGYNIMLIVIFIKYILGSFLPKKLGAVFGLALIVFFAIMVGLSATVIRASIMASLLLLLGLTGRVYLIFRALILAGLVMLVINPYLLVFDPGFQLSFLATLGLILLAPRISHTLEFVPNFFGAREFLVATLATQIFVLPLLLYQIGEFSVVAVLTNVLVLPMVPVAMLLTFLTGVVGFFSAHLSVAISYLTYLSLNYIVTLAVRLSELPFAAFAVPAFPFYLVPLSYGFILYFLWRSSRVKEDKQLAGWTIVEEDEVRYLDK
jgi:competence protein ComEC